jgi:hypothetical protein
MTREKEEGLEYGDMLAQHILPHLTHLEALNIESFGTFLVEHVLHSSLLPISAPTVHHVLMLVSTEARFFLLPSLSSVRVRHASYGHSCVQLEQVFPGVHTLRIDIDRFIDFQTFPNVRHLQFEIDDDVERDTPMVWRVSDSSPPIIPHLANLPVIDSPRVLSTT